MLVGNVHMVQNMHKSMLVVGETWVRYCAACACVKDADCAIVRTKKSMCGAVCMMLLLLPHVDAVPMCVLICFLLYLLLQLAWMERANARESGVASHIDSENQKETDAEEQEESAQMDESA